jgi:hypothetical protein
LALFAARLSGGELPRTKPSPHGALLETGVFGNGSGESAGADGKCGSGAAQDGKLEVCSSHERPPGEPAVCGG